MSDKKVICDESTAPQHSRRSVIKIGLGLASSIGLSSCGGGGSESGTGKILAKKATVSTFASNINSFDIFIYVDGDQTVLYYSTFGDSTIRNNIGWRAGKYRNYSPYTNGPSKSAVLGYPAFIDIDSTKSNLFFSDYYYHTVQKISLTESGTPVLKYAGVSGNAGFLNGPSETATFSKPLGIAVASNGIVYVADNGNHAIRAISTDGMVSTLAGSGTAGYADGIGASAKFNGPYSIAVDSSDNVYVTESINHRIRKITPLGEVTTIAGTGAVGRADGDALSATFNKPKGIAVDLSGYLYVSDTGNNLIRVITPAGKVITLAGDGTDGETDGDALSASFSSPIGITLDDDGFIYVVDYNNLKVRVISFS